MQSSLVGCPACLATPARGERASSDPGCGLLRWVPALHTGRSLGASNDFISNILLVRPKLRGRPSWRVLTLVLIRSVCKM